LRLCEARIDAIVDDGEAYRLRGLVLQALGRAPEAETHFRRSLALNPNSSASYRALAASARARGDLHRARGYLRRARAHDPQDPDRP
jgi:Flp pilus assembly protein TadD